MFELEGLTAEVIVAALWLFAGSALAAGAWRQLVRGRVDRETGFSIQLESRLVKPEPLRDGEYIDGWPVRLPALVVLLGSVAAAGRGAVGLVGWALERLG